MIRSMTGFARTEATGDWGELSWELRAVNHRYLDVHLRLPDELRSLEPSLRQRLSRRLGRGKVECTLRLRAAESDKALAIDEERLAAVVAASRRVAEAAPEAAAPDPLRLLQWPGVLQENVPDLEAGAGAALDAFDRALAELAAMREAEGDRIETFLRERSALVADLAETVRERLPAVREAWREKLMARLAEIDAPAEGGRLEQEAVIVAQRLDVDEELSRLDSHVQALEKALAMDEPVGRRLDFLMQEFNREANTLTSKSQDAEVTRCGVEMKVLIEQMREQVQNVE
ncbi:hypothetical protein PC39_01260 [Salinisphaera sp. PC39]|uniref:YicC/YloC family endoribonuclease n=1 Tax=Salinisphaera sp. PC39 TaxID=1304156 RepID=UPI003340B57E